FRPNTPASHPLMGRIMALETRYDVSTQVLSSLLAPRLPAMCGSATLAMLVSSTSMNAAIATTMAISQGLNRGFQGASTMGAVSATSAIDSLDVDLGFDRHSRTQSVIVVLAGVQIDAHRNALNHLHIIPRGVLRRQQAESGPAGAADCLQFAGVFSTEGVDAELDALAGFHAAELSLFKIGRDPNVIERNHGHQLLTGRNILTGF